MKQISYNDIKNRSSSCVRVFEYTSIAVFNMFLLAAITFLIIYYVIISNTITASNFRISLLSNQLAELTESNSLLTAKKLSVEDSSIILNFAQSHYMTESKYVTHIFESDDVALSR